jgi:phosphomethylpyrimidine synthase
MRKTATKFTTLRLPTSFPASQKMYIQGTGLDLLVPYREIKLSCTKHSHGLEENPPVPVYDCSGPYSDSDCIIDLAQGVPKLRQTWINERGDKRF